MMPFKKTVRNQVFGRFLSTCSTLPSGIHSTQSLCVFPHEFERSCRNPGEESGSRKEYPPFFRVNSMWMEMQIARANESAS